jgi:membrane associated rhomboid family serine protease
MQNHSHSVREEIVYILLFIGVILTVFISTRFIPELKTYGIVPRTSSGLIGIPLWIFLHNDIHHLFSNIVPLFILLALLAGSKANSWEVVFQVALLGGSLLWLFGRNGDHIGASGLIFGLIAFLIVSGFLEQRFVPLMIALVVCFLYGGTLLTGIVPQSNTNISWDGHLYGAIAGGLVAYFLTKDEKPSPENAENPKR